MKKLYASADGGSDLSSALISSISWVPSKCALCRQKLRSRSVLRMPGNVSNLTLSNTCVGSTVCYSGKGEGAMNWGDILRQWKEQQILQKKTNPGHFDTITDTLYIGLRLLKTVIQLCPTTEASEKFSNWCMTRVCTAENVPNIFIASNTKNCEESLYRRQLSSLPSLRVG